MNVVPAGLAGEDQGYSECWKVFCQALPVLSVLLGRGQLGVSGGVSTLTTERRPSHFCT